MVLGNRRAKRLFWTLLVLWCFAVVVGSMPAWAQNVGDDVPTDPVSDDGSGDPGQDGTDNACQNGPCSGGDAGNAGNRGMSRKGNSAGTEGQVATPSPPPVTSETGDGTATTSASRRAGRSSTASRSTRTPAIPTILLYPETATPIPDSTPIPTELPEAETDTEAEAEQAARPVEEPVRETSSGGIPVRRIVGILALLVVIGSAWSLLMQGRRRPGRRSMGRAARRF